MESIHCPSCKKLLAKGTVKALEIKCPRCKTFLVLRAKQSPPTERPRASPLKVDVHGKSAEKPPFKDL
ncbi:Com family DNA-binding transcriptional regulator [Magnetovibrio sp.]|uniref:Com family DNA-binding transcriptional regulator n=1 Tax=Magnetovibrio sp. TaxID=2024836 RepID=UPI0039C8F40B